MAGTEFMGYTESRGMGCPGFAFSYILLVFSLVKDNLAIIPTTRWGLVLQLRPGGNSVPVIFNSSWLVARLYPDW